MESKEDLDHQVCQVSQLLQACTVTLDFLDLTDPKVKKEWLENSVAKEN